MTDQVHVFVSGLVQGVGFRHSLYRQALKLGLQGWVRNRFLREDLLDSTGDTAQSLQFKRQELAVEQQAVADTQALLNRIEEQRRANPQDEDRWTKRVQYLHDALNGSRERIESISAAIRE